MEYELTLTTRTNGQFTEVDSFDRIKADNLTSLLSQLIVLIASLHRREMESSNERTKDDIPF